MISYSIRDSAILVVLGFPKFIDVAEGPFT